MPELSDEDAVRVAKIVAQELLGNRRAIKVGEQRVNVKPRRPAGYTYAYLEGMIGTGLSGTEWDIAFTLAGRADTHGKIVYSAGELCLELGLQTTHLHRAIRHIVDAGLMERVARRSLRLNPAILWHGSSVTQVKLLSEHIGERIRQGLRADGVIE